MSLQLSILKQGAVDFIGERDIQRKLDAGKQLRVKLGVDPTRPDLHLGHMVVLRKLRQFQDLGHKVILIIGDFTATIGDPTGKSVTRPVLSIEETRHNAKSYLEQCALILNVDSPELLEIRYNSEWLSELTYSDMLNLLSKFTVANIMSREDFKTRFSGGIPIGMHELMYPITQGFDSVKVESDIELGGTDQLFNNLVGTHMNDQAVMTMPLLEGIKGGAKMSKSLDNFVALNEDTDTMFAKLMKVDDSVLESYFSLLTDIPLTNLPLSITEAHKLLATTVIRSIRPDADIEGAHRRFKEIAAKKIPSDIPLFHSRSTEINLLTLFVECGLAESKTAARRLLENRGLRVNGELLVSPHQDTTFPSLLKGIVLQRGKDKFMKVIR